MERNLFEEGLGINQREIEELLLETGLPQEISREPRSWSKKADGVESGEEKVHPVHPVLIVALHGR